MDAITVSMTKSHKPKKQRAYFFGMALHKVQKSLGCHLSKALRKEIGARAIGIRKGDRVKVMRGKNKGKEGKVARVDYKRRHIFVEGVTAKKSSGAEIQPPLQNSNLMIVELERKDERRLGKKAQKEKPKKKEAKQARKK